jgi:hypothetical protein
VQLRSLCIITSRWDIGVAFCIMDMPTQISTSRTVILSLMVIVDLGTLFGQCLKAKEVMLKLKHAEGEEDMSKFMGVQTGLVKRLSF